MAFPLRAPSRPIHMHPPHALGQPHPLPNSYKPQNANTPHRVQDGETWRTLANQYGVAVEKIILFNFETLVSDHVNWYLQKITGCNKTTDDINWAFSSSARPGIVYIPPVTIDFADEPETVEVKRSRRTPISKWFDPPKKPSNSSDLAGKAIDIIGAIDAGLAIFTAVELPLAIGVGVAVIGGAGPILTIAGAHQDAINLLITDSRMSGFSQGIVVGAFGKGTDFAQTYFINNHRNFNSAYRDQRKNLEMEYKRAFASGYFTGKDFTMWERSQFFKHLHSKMIPHPQLTYGEDRTRWPVNYFIEVATVFRRLHLR